MRGHFDVFMKITARWHLTQAEQRALLRSPTKERWVHLVHDAVPRMTPDEFARVNAVIQIDEALSNCISDPREAARWLRTLKSVTPFLGRTPLALLFRGMEGFQAVVDYLKAWQAAGRA